MRCVYHAEQVCEVVVWYILGDNHCIKQCILPIRLHGVLYSKTKLYDRSLCYCPHDEVLNSDQTHNIDTVHYRQTMLGDVFSCVLIGTVVVLLGFYMASSILIAGAGLEPATFGL